MKLDLENYRRITSFDELQQIDKAARLPEDAMIELPDGRLLILSKWTINVEAGEAVDVSLTANIYVPTTEDE